MEGIPRKMGRTWRLEESLYKISNKVLGSKIHKQCLKIDEKASNTNLGQKNEQEFLPAMGSKQISSKDKEENSLSVILYRNCGHWSKIPLQNTIGYQERCEEQECPLSLGHQYNFATEWKCSAKFIFTMLIFRIYLNREFYTHTKPARELYN